jgi:hypothetical protein
VHTKAKTNVRVTREEEDLEIETILKTPRYMSVDARGQSP